MPYSKIKSLSLASAVAMTLAIPVETIAAVDMFIKFDGVDGESADDKHKNWIDVLAWSWGMSTDSRGRACVQDISLTKWIDSASAPLSQALPSNQSFANARLVVRKAGSDPLVFLTYDMTNVKLSSLSTGGSGGEDRLTENISFNFEELLGTYIMQNDDGSGGASSTFIVPGNRCK